MIIDDLLIELEEAEQRFWFIQRSEIERTDEAIRLRLIINAALFIQVYLSEATERFSLALIQGRERLYGRDREGGTWHLHPFDSPETHCPTPEGVSSRPLLQFLAEVEELLLENELI
jgi:hypothetical protein